MMMGIRKKLAAFSAETKAGEVIVLDFQAKRQDELPHDNEPHFRKAA